MTRLFTVVTTSHISMLGMRNHLLVYMVKVYSLGTLVLVVKVNYASKISFRVQYAIDSAPRHCFNDCFNARMPRVNNLDIP